MEKQPPNSNVKRSVIQTIDSP